MKNKEQIRKEIINYVEKSSKHLFLIGDNEHKVFLHDKYCISITGDRIVTIDIDKIIEWYNGNSKSVISDMIFLIPRYGSKIKSIPYYKAAKEKYNGILKSLNGISDLNQIRDSIKIRLK